MTPYADGAVRSPLHHGAAVEAARLWEEVGRRRGAATHHARPHRARTILRGTSSGRGPADDGRNGGAARREAALVGTRRGAGIRDIRVARASRTREGGRAVTGRPAATGGATCGRPPTLRGGRGQQFDDGSTRWFRRYAREPLGSGHFILFPGRRLRRRGGRIRRRRRRSGTERRRRRLRGRDMRGVTPQKRAGVVTGSVRQAKASMDLP